jgi:hypothetical protein
MTNCFVHANQGPAGFIDAHQLVRSWLNKETFVVPGCGFDVNVAVSAHVFTTPSIIVVKSENR